MARRHCCSVSRGLATSGFARPAPDRQSRSSDREPLFKRAAFGRPFSVQLPRLKTRRVHAPGLSTAKPWSREGPAPHNPRGAGFFWWRPHPITPISPHLLEGCDANGETGRPDRDGRGLGGVASVPDDALVLRTAHNRALRPPQAKAAPSEGPIRGGAPMSA